jgi:hypothetical protein
MRYLASMRASQQQEETSLSNANLIILAERELAAFYKAVSELFGSKQARLSAAEWIDELESIDWPARPGVSDFRRITNAAIAKFAHREQSRIRMRSDGFRVGVSPHPEQRSDVTVKQMYERPQRVRPTDQRLAIRSRAYRPTETSVHKRR